MNSGAELRSQNCGVGEKPWLDIPRLAGHGGGSFEIAPRIIGCKRTRWGPLQVVAFRIPSQFCWATDLPKLGLSQGAKCLTDGEAWSKRCPSICISSVTRIAEGRSAGTLTMGELKTVASVMVEGGKKRSSTTTRGMVVDVKKYLDADSVVVKHPAIFVAILPHCVGGRTIRATAVLNGGRSIRAQYGLPLSKPCIT
jgi:hypothetical protein